MSNTIQQEALGISYVLLDLAKQSVNVYLPIHGHVTPDLIAIKDGTVLRIEVKGLSTFKDCSKSYPKQENRYDVLAQVNVKTGEIRYLPPLVSAVNQVQTKTLTRKEKAVLTVMREEK